MSKHDSIIAELLHILENKANQSSDVALLSAYVIDNGKAIKNAFEKFHASTIKYDTDKNHFFSMANERKKILDVNYSHEIDLADKRHDFNLNELKGQRDQRIKDLSRELNRLSNAKNHEILTIEDAYTQKIETIEKQITTLEEQKNYIVSFFNKSSDDIIKHRDRKNSDIDANILEIKHIYLETISLLKTEFQEQISRLKAAYDKELKELQSQRVLFDGRIHKLAITINDTISLINADFKKWHAYGEVPYQIEKNNLLEERREMDNELVAKEHAILAEFMRTLDAIDSEHETKKTQFLREKDSIVRELHKLSYRFQIALSSEKRKLERGMKKTPEQSKKLMSSFRSFEKKIRRELQKEQRYLLSNLRKIEIGMLKNTEYVRTKKRISESLKGTKIKDWNMEKEMHAALFEIDFALIDARLEAYAASDNLEETIKILSAREHFDKETIQIKHEILILNQRIHILEDSLKFASAFYEQEHEHNEQFYQSDFDAKNRVLTLDIEQSQIEALLNVERERIIKNYASTYFALKVKDLRNQIDFQSRREKLDINLVNIKYNHEIQVINNKIDDIMENFKISISEIENQRSAEIREETIQHFFNVGISNQETYVERFTNEKHVLRSCFLKYVTCLATLNQLEEYIIKNIACNETIAELLSFFLKYRLTFLDDFIDTKRYLIQERISFESGVKYDLILHDLSTAYENALKKHTDTLDKLSETVNNYEKAIAVFKDNITNAKREKAIVQNEYNLLNKDRKSNQDVARMFALQDQIGELEALIHRYYINIKNNEASMKDLFAMSSRLERKIQSIKTRYKRQHSKTIKDKILDSRGYYSSLSNLKKQKSNDRYELKTAYLRNKDELISLNKETFLNNLSERNITFHKKTSARHNQFFVHLYRNVNADHALMKDKYSKNFAKARQNFLRQQDSIKQITANRYNALHSSSEKKVKQFTLTLRDETFQKQEMVVSLTRNRQLASLQSDNEIEQNIQNRSNSLAALDENLLSFLKKNKKAKAYYEKKRIQQEKLFFRTKLARQQIYQKNSVEESIKGKRKISDLQRLCELRIADYATETKETFARHQRNLSFLKTKESRLVTVAKRRKAIENSKFNLALTEHEYAHIQAVELIRVKSAKRMRVEKKRIKNAQGFSTKHREI